jgi:hypothetical protein
MQRTYLFVPPEERQDVQTLGAHWDDDSKRWYIDLNQSSRNFGRWLPAHEESDEQVAEGFTIISDEAYVALAGTSCQRCARLIHALCIYCESGTVNGEPLSQFTVSNISAIDESVLGQLRSWPHFHRSRTPPYGVFTTHCAHCGFPQEDAYLHSEPGDVFFDIPSVPAGTVQLIPLTGTVTLSGDEHFAVG